MKLSELLREGFIYAEPLSSISLTNRDIKVFCRTYTCWNCRKENSHYIELLSVSGLGQQRLCPYCRAEYDPKKNKENKG